MCTSLDFILVFFLQHKKSYSSWQESVHTTDIILHQATLSVTRSLNSLVGGANGDDKLEQSSLQALARELLYRDTHCSVGCLLSLEVRFC